MKKKSIDIQFNQYALLKKIWYMHYFGKVAMEENFLKKTSKEAPNNVSFLFQLVTLSISGSIIFALIYVAVFNPTPVEQFVLISPLTPAKIEESRSLPSIVQVGLSINHFKHFDIMNNIFSIEGAIWFEYDPSHISLDTISKFSFEKAEIKYLSTAKTRMVGKNVLARFDFVLEFIPELAYMLFPLDDHLISLVVVNKDVSLHQMILNSDRSKLIADDVEEFGWSQYYKSVHIGYESEVLNNSDQKNLLEFPAIQFSLYYSRISLKYAITLLLPMLVFLVINILSFSFDPEKNFSSIMVANGASLSGLIGFRFVIESMAPKVSYFMISDFYFSTILLMIVMLFLINIFSPYLTLRIRKILLISVHCFTVAIFACATWYVFMFAIYISDSF